MSEITTTVAPFRALDPAEVEVLGAARAAHWQVDRSLFKPRIWRVQVNGTLAACALVVARRGTGYLKIADIWCDTRCSPTLQRQLCDNLIQSVMAAATPETIVVKVEEHLQAWPYPVAVLECLRANTFVKDIAPLPSVESTYSGVRSFSRWQSRQPHQAIRYYGQTTEVTCGAVTALMACEAVGAGQLTDTDRARNRAVEIELWRSATNMPAVEPVALAVTTARVTEQQRLSFGMPTVYLSEPNPVLLEDFSGDDWRIRAELQAESVLAAAQLGIEIVPEWITVEAICECVQAGAFVFLLIDLTPMIQDPTPHWVLAHDVIDGCVIVEDPWVHYPVAETWVDAHNLPIPFDSLDQMMRWGEPAYRGAVVVPRG